MIFLTKRIKSGALQFTIFIGVVIAIILSGLLLLYYTHNFFIQQNNFAIANIGLANNAMETLCSKNINVSDTLPVNLQSTDVGQNAKRIISHWGIYEKAFVVVNHRKKIYTKSALIGSCQGKQKRPALYLQETYNPLAVVGKTHIEGTAYLPNQGITTGYILGDGYFNSQLLYGQKLVSSQKLPKLKYDYKKVLGFYLNKYAPKKALDYIEFFARKKIINSFNKPVKGFFSNDVIVLDNIKLYGNIIIRSSSKIIVKKNALLNDIIIAAPEIIIEDDVKGNFQAFATKSIETGENCLLNYPSALVISRDNDNNKYQDSNTYCITINKGTSIFGTIGYLESDVKSDFKNNIFIDTNCLIKGEVYCNANFEMRGTIYGSVYTSQFLANREGTIFTNHLYNVEINNSKLYDGYGGILLYDEPKSIMKWLY